MFKLWCERGIRISGREPSISAKLAVISSDNGDHLGLPVVLTITEQLQDATTFRDGEA